MSTRSGPPIRIRFAKDSTYSRRWLDANPAAAQRIYRKFAKVRPVCLCVPSGVEMYVALKESAYLATMPGRTHHHSPRCPSFEFDESTTGRSFYTRGGLNRHARGTTLTVSGPGSQCDFESLSLTAVLHFLWEEAGLNQWSPKMDGKRNYFVACYAVLNASERIWLGKHRLSDFLSLKLSRSQSITPPKDIEYLLGQVIRLFPSQYGVGLKLKYHEKPVWISTTNYRKAHLDLIFGAPESPHLPRRYCFVLCHGNLSSAGNFSCDDVGFLPLTPRFIPSFSDEEDRVISSLFDRQLRFYRCLPYDASADLLPFAVLYSRERPPNPVSLEDISVDIPIGSIEPTALPNGDLRTG